MKNRPEYLQSFLNLFAEPRYLEIGVRKGHTFHAVEAVKKVAVDPKFIFPDEERQSNCEYHEITSDDYFGNTPNQIFDVIYLDGLHTFEQTLRDLLNAIACSHERSIIVIDDVCPPTSLSSLADRKLFNEVRTYIGMPDYKVWMGDVYKLVHFIDSFMQQYSFATVEENHGQTVVWRKARTSVRPKDVELLAKMDFNSYVLYRGDMNILPFSDILNLYKMAYPSLV